MRLLKPAWLILIISSFFSLNAQEVNIEEAIEEVSNYLKVDLSPRSSGISFYALNKQRNISLGLGYFASTIDTTLTKRATVPKEPYRLHSFPVIVSVHKNLFKKKLHFRAEAAGHLFGSNKFQINRYYHVDAELIFSQSLFFAGVGLKKPMYISDNFTIRESPYLYINMGINF